MILFLIVIGAAVFGALGGLTIISAGKEIDPSQLIQWVKTQTRRLWHKEC